MKRTMIPATGMRALALGAVLACATSLLTPALAKHAANDPSQLAQSPQKAAMQQLKKQQRDQWSALRRQQSQESKLITDKASLRRLQQEQRDALKRQQKIQKDILKGH